MSRCRRHPFEKLRFHTGKTSWVSVAKLVAGPMLAIATQMVVFPWFGIETGLAEHMTIGLVFLGVSLIRGYLLRRLFEHLRFAAQRR